MHLGWLYPRGSLPRISLPPLQGWPWTLDQVRRSPSAQESPPGQLLDGGGLGHTAHLLPGSCHLERPESMAEGQKLMISIFLAYLRLDVFICILFIFQKNPPRDVLFSLYKWEDRYINNLSKRSCSEGENELSFRHTKFSKSW